MPRDKIFAVIFLLLCCAGTGFGAAVILNEYNAVSASNYLNGGTAEQDVDGGYASDSYFGRVLGNGGDWFELVVIQDHLDMRWYRLYVSYFDGAVRQEEILNLTNNSIWSDLRSGTIITVSEDVPDDVSYDPLNGDWWINVRASASGSGLYIEKQNFPVSNDDWQIRIFNPNNVLIFGPAGEGINPVSGISSTEICRLQDDPNTSITELSNYNDGKTLSTFGAPNRWPGGNVQDFSQIRTGNTIAITGYIKNPCDTPIEGVTVGADNGGGEGITDINGYYEVMVGYNWSGTVTPVKENHTFSPESIAYLNVLNGIANQNYTATNIYDLDCDGSIGWSDVAILRDNWLSDSSGCICDLNADNIINFLDFAEFALVW